MLDGSLTYSFFTRDKNKNIIGMNSHLGWHSECGGESSNSGAMMINHHYKSNIDYDSQLSKFASQLIDLEDIQNQSPDHNESMHPKGEIQ